MISKNEEHSDLDRLLETMHTKFKRNRARGQDLHVDRNNKHYVQNDCDFLMKRRRQRMLIGQNVNENNVTKNVIAIGLFFDNIISRYEHVHIQPSF